MRLVAKSFSGNVPDACQQINNKGGGAAARLFQIVPVSSGITIAIFRFEDYPSYVYFCEKWQDKPLPVEEYFK